MTTKELISKLQPSINFECVKVLISKLEKIDNSIDNEKKELDKISMTTFTYNPEIAKITERIAILSEEKNKLFEEAKQYILEDK